MDTVMGTRQIDRAAARLNLARIFIDRASAFRGKGDDAVADTWEMVAGELLTQGLSIYPEWQVRAHKLEHCQFPELIKRGKVYDAAYRMAKSQIEWDD